ncbi:MAG: ABC transporter permease [Anaerolineae bacterium]|nr:ABC transporter permease [Anaerolineae bacterium]
MLSLDRRWVKVLNDLWLYKSRTLVVITAIALGVTGVGLVATTQVVLMENYVAQYWAASPAQARIGLTSFGESALRKIRELPDVIAAEARHQITARVELEPGKPMTLSLQALPDFNSITVDKLTYLPGAQVPPPTRGILLERAVLNNFHLKIGDTIQVRMPDGKQHTLTISGFLIDSIVIPTPISSTVYGYVTFETAYWLEQDEKGVFVPVLHQNYDRLLVITHANPFDKTEIEASVSQLKRDISRLAPNPPYVLSVTIPTVGKPTLQDNVNSMSIVLQVAGITSLALSGFLVVNIMTALISQQIKQIGILKAIGGRTMQIASIYLTMSMVLGGVSFLIAVPLGELAAFGVTHFIANILNTDVSNFYLPLNTVGIQAITALLVPALATIVPAWAGTRMTAREAMMSTGGSGTSSGGWLNRLTGTLLALPMPILLSVRNVFRQRIRLLLTLVALSIGGATFIAVMGTRGALNTSFDELQKENNYDIMIRYELDRDTLAREVEKTVLEIAGVRSVETWKSTVLRRVFEDGSQSSSVGVIAVPDNTQMLLPKAVQGHWLQPEGRSTLFTNFDGLEALGHDAMDAPIKIEMNGVKEMWQLVGVSSRTLNPTAYIRMDDFDRFYKNPPAQRLLVIQTDQADRVFVEAVETQIINRFKDKKWNIDSSLTLSRNIGSAQSQINNVVYVLLGTAALIAAVGGLGLANTLELNVMEHTREIGVLRSLGARNYIIRMMVMTESMTICVISIIIGTLLSSPFGEVLANQIGTTLLARKLTYAFPPGGMVLWIVIIGTLSLMASLGPAQNAIKLTVRDTLAYE